MVLIRFSSPVSKVPALLSCRIRFPDFFVRMWFLKARLCRIFPVAVRRNRFAAFCAPVEIG